MAKYPDVTAGQTEACINRMGGWENFLRFIGGAGRIVFEEVEQVSRRILRLISGDGGIEIAATDGSETLAKARDVFVGYIDQDFENWKLDKVGPSNGPRKVEVHEMVEDGMFSQIFADLGRPLDELCLTQAQIKRFCCDHSRWLRSDGYGSFFLFKENDQFFVAGVFVYDGRLGVYVYQLEDDYVWYGEYRHRIVVPQQTPVLSV